MKRLLVIGHVWPEPKTTAAGNRMMQLLEFFLANSYQIIFASTAQKTQHSESLDLLGIAEKEIVLNHSSFDSFVSQFQPDVVLFDRFMVEEQFGWRVAETCPNAIRILNTEDLHSLREYREECFNKEKVYTTSGWLQHDKTKRELASIYRSDLTLLVSSFEKELLQKTVDIGQQLVLHLPFLLDTISAKTIAAWPTFEERVDFITYGNGKHAPNVDSFTFLKSEIWPLIRKELPKGNLHLYGAYLPQHVLEMHNPKTGFLVHGWLDDLDTEIQKSRVVLAPLRFGAGIKGKLIRAMQNGAPSVSTNIGVEGMYNGGSWAGNVADSPEEFAQKAIELYTNIKEWKQAQNNGVEIINTVYDKFTSSAKLLQCINAIQQNLSEHRSKNIVGNLLQHQTMAATKYMGKWIEEKNLRTKS